MCMANSFVENLRKATGPEQAWAYDELLII